jgi:TolB-like protein
VQPPDSLHKAERAASGQEPQVSAESVRAALERVLASRCFRSAETLSRLLRYTVEQGLEGRGDRLKEYSLGVDVLGRGPRFDPRVDSVVRVEASRLRSRLAEYYRTEGADDPIRIEIPRGSYIPRITAARPEFSLVKTGNPAKGRSGTKRTKLVLWSSAVLTAALLLWIAALSVNPRFMDRPASTPPSVAVLPFATAGLGKDASWLGPALTAEVTDALTKLPGLNIAARSSVLDLKNRGAGIRDIGRQLGVAVVLDGSIHQVGDHLRVTAELIGTGDGYYRWSHTYEGAAADISTMPAKIALAVAGNLGLSVAPQNTSVLLQRRTASAEAYHLVVKGRYLGVTGERSEEKLNYYRRALQYDPRYAEAWIGLADEWVRLAAQGTVAPREVMEKARDAVDRALQIDPDMTDGHFLSALIKSGYEWDWAGAEREYLRTLELNPGSPHMHIRYARHLALMGRRNDALNQLEHIRRLEPIPPQMRGIEANVLYLTRDYDRTIELARAVLAGQSRVWLLHFWMGRAYESKGMLTEAIEALEKWYGLPGTQQGRGFGMLASVYARAGRREDALRLLRSAIERSRTDYVSPCSVALIYIGLGDFPRAFEWLDKGYEARDQSMVTLKADPAYDPLRQNPKFVSLIRKMRFE